MRRLISLGVIIGAATVPAASNTPAGSGTTNSTPNSNSNTAKAATTSNTTLTIDNENGALWTCDFNPYNQAENFLTVGFDYEPLVFVNPLQASTRPPWMLATSWAWGAGNKSLTFQIRQGVTFSNGEPMTGPPTWRTPSTC